MKLRLLDDWQDIVRNAWSVRFWVISIICQAVGAGLYFLNGPSVALFVAAFIASALGTVARHLAQPEPGTVWARIRSFLRDSSGAANFRPRHAIVPAVVLAVAVPVLYRLEGVRTTSYQDIVGVWTYCVGETQGAGPGQQYTLADCRSKLNQRLQDLYAEVVRAIPLAPQLPPDTQAALLSIWYNEGDGTMRNSSVARAGRAGRWHDMCRAFMNFQRPPQLHDRRVFERDLCLHGLDRAGIVQ